VGGGADDHRHAKRPRREQHQLEIVALPLLRAAVLVGAERLRPDVAASGVRDDRVGMACDAELEAPALDGREAEVTGGRQDAQALRHGDLIVHDLRLRRPADADRLQCAPAGTLTWTTFSSAVVTWSMAPVLPGAMPTSPCTA